MIRPSSLRLALLGILVQQPLGQVDKAGVERIFHPRHGLARLPKSQVVEHLVSRGLEPRGQPVEHVLRDTSLADHG